MFNRKLKQQLKEAESIITSFQIMLDDAHLSENKSAGCEFARMEIREYWEKWSK